MVGLSQLQSRKNASCECKLQLTSLVDVMTILLVFLLKSFSVEGHNVTRSADLRLPLSSSNSSAKTISSLILTEDELICDNNVITTVNTIRGCDSMSIPALLDWIKSHKTLTDSSAKEIMIQSDRDQSFDVLKKVMFTCSQAGIKDFSILVLHEE